MIDHIGIQEEISIKALQAGDRAEFARFVDNHSGLIYRLALKMLGNEMDAEDVLQETFIKAFHHINSFKGDSRISTWLYRIATNEALMLIRKRRPESSHIDIDVEGENRDDQTVEIVDWGILPEEKLLSSESIQYLDRAAAKLTPALRIVFILRDIQGLSVSETADVLQLSENVVKTRLSRARLQLRNELSRYFEPRLGSEG